MNEARKSDTPACVAGAAPSDRGQGATQPARERRRLGLRYGADTDAKGERP